MKTAFITLAACAALLHSEVAYGGTGDREVVRDSLGRIVAVERTSPEKNGRSKKVVTDSSGRIVRTESIERTKSGKRTVIYDDKGRIVGTKTSSGK